MAVALQYQMAVGSHKPMLRIQRATNGKTVFSLSGRIEPDDIEELRRLLGLESWTVPIVLNLKELVLADREAVEFLAGCEAAGVTLKDCPAYVRTWIDRGREQSK